MMVIIYLVLRDSKRKKKKKIEEESKSKPPSAQWKLATTTHWSGGAISLPAKLLYHLLEGT
jgi:hypothetical protein